MENFKEKYYRLLELAPREEVDEYAKKQLKKRLLEWYNKEKNYLVSLEYFVNGKEFDNLMSGVYNIEHLEKMKVKFLRPDLDMEWNFTRPTKELLEKEGKGLCRSFDYDYRSLNKWVAANKMHNEKVMVRAHISDFFEPISIKTKSQYHHAEEVPQRYQPRLKTLSGLWQDMRCGVLPFEIRLSLYTPEDRYLYLIDPVADMQKPHPLSHVTYERERREAIDYLHFDTVVARIGLPKLVRNIMEFIFECGEKTLPDVAHTFNVAEKIAQNSVQSLVSKGLVKKRKDVYYHISMETIREYYQEYISNPPK